MWNKLAFNHKKALSFGAFFLALCIAYQLSFSKAIEAIKLNHQLHNEEQETQNVGVAYPQIESKNSFYIQALKLYIVNPDDRENRLWQAVSGIALAKETKISFNPIAPSLSDTSKVAHRIFIHEFNFKGSYFNCVSLLDSLSKTPGIGIISSVKLSVPKENDQGRDILSLKLTLATRIK